MNWTSAITAAFIATFLVSGVEARAGDKVRLGEPISFVSSVCFNLADLMEIREYALANQGDGKTAYLKKKAEGKCLPFNSLELGVRVILDAVVDGSEFNDAILGPTIFVKFHVEGMKEPLYGVMGPEQLALSSI